MTKVANRNACRSVNIATLRLRPATALSLAALA